MKKEKKHFSAPDDISSAFSILASFKEELPSTGPSMLLGLSQPLPCVGRELFWTSPAVARVAPEEKSEPIGSCSVRHRGFFVCFLTKELEFVF